MSASDFEITVDEADLMSFDVLVDISTQDHSVPALESAVATSYETLTTDPGSVLNRARRALVVCDRGVTSRIAVALLRNAGYSNTTSLVGGTEALARSAGVATGSRYDRQTRLAGFGTKGQQQLESPTIAVVGVGGLGCPALSVIVPAGIGTVKLIDFDTVDASNLHRQPLFTPDDVGRRKVEVAEERLKSLNPRVSIEPMSSRLTIDNATDLLSGADVVVDATDTFAARQAITAATVEAGLPMIYGSIFGFEGQFAVFAPPEGPCYRCVFPTTPDATLVIDCASVGTLGAVTSVIGSLQAAAAIELAAGVETDLTGFLTMYDARTARFDRLPVTRNPTCEMCGS